MRRNRYAGHALPLYRIGVNLGDVIVEPEDIFGDGVNIAARLELIAEPGGVCISSAVRDQVGDRLTGLEDLGDQQVKNINRPIRVYRVVIGGQKLGAGHPAENRPAAPKESAKKPSIAILPFLNMSGDPEQEFFADGLTEADIITELSRFRQLAGDLSQRRLRPQGASRSRRRQIAREFGVDYIVRREACARRPTGVRVTVQLIDGETEAHVWAERYDRKLEDIFAIQDEVTSSIRLDPVRPRRGRAARAAPKRQTTANMAAYEEMHRPATRPSPQRRTAKADVEALPRAGGARSSSIQTTPTPTHGWRASAGRRGCTGWCDEPGAFEQRIIDESQIALTLDDNDGACSSDSRRAPATSMSTTRRPIIRNAR